MTPYLGSFVRRGFLTLALGGLALAAGCDSAEPTFAERDLVAVIDGDLFLGILADGEHVAVYSCNGTEDAATVTVNSWFKGDNADGAFDIDADDNAGLRITGTFADDGTAAGTLIMTDGAERPFTASPASDGEGVYVAEEGDLYGTWVEIGDAVRGAVINRNTGDLITTTSFSPSSETVTIDGVTLSPIKKTIAAF